MLQGKMIVLVNEVRWHITYSFAIKSYLCRDPFHNVVNTYNNLKLSVEKTSIFSGHVQLPQGLHSSQFHGWRLQCSHQYWTNFMK